jgi:HlyD family secretion protein
MNIVWRALKQLFWLSIVILVVAVALIIGFWSQPPWVEVAEAFYGPMPVSVKAQGKTRIIDRYIVSTPIPGSACRSHLKVGDYVTKNQAVVSIEPLRAQALDPQNWAEARSRVSATESAARIAEQAALTAKEKNESANDEWKRGRSLAKKGDLPQGRLDEVDMLVRRTKMLRRSADFVADIARYELKAARTALKYVGAKGELNAGSALHITAPTSGRILRIYQKCKAAIAAEQPLFEIGDMQSLDVESEVLSSDAVRIVPGMRVVFQHWGGEPPLQGRVRIVEPIGKTRVSAQGMEEQRVRVVSDLVSESSIWQGLGDAYGVESVFILKDADNTLQIPMNALRGSNLEWSVFVLKKGRAIKRILTLGQKNSTSIEVLDGLEAGEKVVTYADEVISDGIKVRLGDEPLSYSWMDWRFLK